MVIVQECTCSRHVDSTLQKNYIDHLKDKYLAKTKFHHVVIVHLYTMLSGLFTSSFSRLALKCIPAFSQSRAPYEPLYKATPFSRA